MLAEEGPFEGGGAAAVDGKPCFEAPFGSVLGVFIDICSAIVSCSSSVNALSSLTLMGRLDLVFDTASSPSSTSS